jgi:hypothetical protein
LASIEPGLSGVSPQDAPLFESDDLSGETEPITIGHGAAFQSPQWQAAFPTGRLRSFATGLELARLKLLARISWIVHRLEASMPR